MIELETPNGLLVEVPEVDSEDPSPKFDQSELDLAKSYYEENGYVVFRRLINKDICDEVRKIWDAEVKHSDQFIYRQATARAERNVLNENGWVMNPILNLQSLNPMHFGKLRKFAVANILTTRGLNDSFTKLLGDTPKIVQSMYFEGNSATWEHQDSYYLDSENIGSMAAAWIALEDINATAGRFFVCPGTHRIDLGRQKKANNIAENHSVYINQIVNLMKERSMPIRAPKLDRGDVLFWNAWTIHGSLKSNESRYSRSSITCHAIRLSDLFLQLHARKINVVCDTINGVKVWRPKDQGKLICRLILRFESTFPSLFLWIETIRH